MGLILSSSYLVLTLILKGVGYSRFTKALEEQGIAYSQLETRPTPFNSVLWTANVETDTSYLIGNYSFFDSKEIEFTEYPKNHELLDGLATNDKVVRLKNIAQYWFTLSSKDGRLFFNDLRFGLISLGQKETQFAFSYELVGKGNDLKVVETPRKVADAKGILTALWQRIWGN